MRIILLVLLVLLTGIGFASTSLAEQKVLVIGIDGLRADALDLATAAGQAPHIQSLVNNGSHSNNAKSSQLSFSGPGWTSILHGVDIDQHLVSTNSVSGGVFAGSNQAAYPDFLARVNSYDPAINTARFTTWSPLAAPESAGTANGTGTPGGTNFDYFQDYTADGDNLATTAAVNHFTTADPDVTFFYFADLDVVGHAGHYDADEVYLAELEQIDGYIGQLVSGIESRPTFANEDWLYVLTSDHGGTGSGHGANTDLHRTVPFIVSGDSVVKQSPAENPMFVGPKLYDVTPTVLAHMGIPTTEAAWNNLAGRPIGFTASVGPQLANGQNLVFNGDAEYDHAHQDFSYDKSVSGWEDPAGSNSVTVLEYGAPGGFPTNGDPGPGDRGDNFFSATQSSSSATLTQLLDVSDIAGSIDADDVDFDLSAYLGGYNSQEDNSVFTSRFLNEFGSEISQVSIGPVTAADRSGQTGLLFRQALGDVPVGTRAIEFVLRSTDNDGYADNLAFSISGSFFSPLIPGDFDNDTDVDFEDWMALRSHMHSDLTSVPESEWRSKGDMNQDGFVNHFDFTAFKQAFEDYSPSISFAQMASGVPEPSGILIMTIVLSATVVRRHLSPARRAK